MNTTCVALQSGEQLALRLPRGTRLVVLSGRLSAQPPALWLGDTLVRRQEDWHEGHAAVIDEFSLRAGHGSSPQRFASASARAGS